MGLVVRIKQVNVHKSACLELFCALNRSLQLLLEYKRAYNLKMRTRSQNLPFPTQLWVEETNALGDFRVTAEEEKVLVPHWKGGGLVRQEEGSGKER